MGVLIWGQGGWGSASWGPGSNNGVAKIGTMTSHGVPIISSPVSNVLVNGVAIAVIGSVIQNHYTDPTHNNKTVSGGSGNVFANGIGVARIGDPTTCGAVLVASGASTDTLAG